MNIESEKGYRQLEKEEIVGGDDYIHMMQVEKFINGNWYAPVWPNDKNGVYRTKLSKRDLHLRMGFPLVSAPKE